MYQDDGWYYLCQHNSCVDCYYTSVWWHILPCTPVAPSPEQKHAGHNIQEYIRCTPLVCNMTLGQGQYHQVLVKNMVQTYGMKDIHEKYLDPRPVSSWP